MAGQGPQFAGRRENQLRAQRTQQIEVRRIDEARRGVPRDGDARSRLHAMGQVWVGKVDEWGPSAVRMRSHRGLLERVNEQDSPMKALYGTLEPVIREMIADGLAPALRKRGLIRDGYHHSTFRENLLEF